MKKLLSLLFASMVVFSLTMPVFARSASTTPASTSSKANKTKANKTHKTNKAIKSTKPNSSKTN